MSQVIIYKNDDGGVSVIYPTPEALAIYGVDAIAQKDVPAGKPFKIINSADLPDRSFRDAWEVNKADLTDGVGADYNEFPAPILEDVEVTE